MGGVRCRGDPGAAPNGHAPYLCCGGLTGGRASCARREVADCSQPRHLRIYLSSNRATVDFSTQSKDFTAR